MFSSYLYYNSKLFIQIYWTSEFVKKRKKNHKYISKNWLIAITSLLDYKLAHDAKMNYSKRDRAEMEAERELYFCSIRATLQQEGARPLYLIR